jgi:hypothetical protein
MFSVTECERLIINAVRPAQSPTLRRIQGVAGFFPGVKRLGRGVNHPPSSSAEVKERVELHLYSSSGPSWTVLVRTFSCLLLLMLGSPRNFVEDTKKSAY